MVGAHIRKSSVPMLLAQSILLVVFSGACVSMLTGIADAGTDPNYGIGVADSFAGESDSTNASGADTYLFTLSIILVCAFLAIVMMWTVTGGMNTHRKTILLVGVDSDAVRDVASKYFTSQGYSLKSGTSPDQLVFTRGSYVGLTLNTIRMYLAVLVSRHDDGVAVRCEFYTPGTKLFRENINALDDGVDSFKQFLTQHTGAREI